MTRSSVVISSLSTQRKVTPEMCRDDNSVAIDLGLKVLPEEPWYASPGFRAVFICRTQPRDPLYASLDRHLNVC